MKTTYTQLTRTCRAIAWSLCVVLAFPTLLHAETVITNNVSVTSSSSGGNSTSHASVHTTINGETVEDVSLTSSDDEAISYISSHIYEDETVVSTISTTTPRDQEKQQELKTLLERLVALLTFYVSKLSL